MPCAWVGGACGLEACKPVQDLEREALRAWVGGACGLVGARMEAVLHAFRISGVTLDSVKRLKDKGAIQVGAKP